jgi:succinate dehydrogenase / fumarate reductase flavoprotein subunit
VAEYITHEHDVVIIGAGGAGLRAATEASAAGAKVAVITKSLLATGLHGEPANVF